MATQKLQTFLTTTIDLSGRGGLSDKFYGDIAQQAYDSDTLAGQPNLRYKASDGQMVSGVFNPLRRDGYMYPSVGSLDTVSCPTATSFAGSVAYDDVNNRIYFLEHVVAGAIRDPKLHRLDSLDDLSLSDSHTLPASTITCSDLAIYTINGVKTMFYTYQKSSEWRVGTLNLVSGTYTDLWLGTGGSVSGTFGPTDSGEMKLIPAGDGYMYILNANHVHRVDGTSAGGANGTITQDVLLAPTDYRFSHGIDYRNNLYIVIQRSTYYENHTSSNSNNITSACGVYVWNRSSTGFNTSDFIPISGIREIRSIYVSPRGEIRLITISADHTTQIRRYTGSSFEVIKELGAYAYPNFEDSLCVLSGFTVWLGMDGNIYYHGNEKKDEPEFLFIAGQIGPVTATTSGTPFYATGPIFYAAGTPTMLTGVNRKDVQGIYTAFIDNTSGSSAYKYRKLYPFADGNVGGGGGITTYALQGDVYSPVKILPRLSTIHAVTIYMAPASVSGTTVAATLKFYANQSSSSFMSKSVTYNDIAKGYIEIEVNKPYVNAIQIEVEWPTTELANNKNFAPSIAIIEYEPEGSLK